jgi:hypothetical protein
MQLSSHWGVRVNGGDTLTQQKMRRGPVAAISSSCSTHRSLPSSKVQGFPSGQRTGIHRPLGSCSIAIKRPVCSWINETCRNAKIHMPCGASPSCHAVPGLADSEAWSLGGDRSQWCSVNDKCNWRQQASASGRLGPQCVASLRAVLSCGAVWWLLLPSLVMLVLRLGRLASMKESLCMGANH